MKKKYEIAKPNLKSVPEVFQYYPLEISTEPAEWRKGWLCRLLRWLYFKLVKFQLHDRIFPKWLIPLIHARQVYVNYSIERLPDNVIEQIAMMRQYLSSRGTTPKMIVIGAKKKHELETVTGYGDYWAENLIGYQHDKFMGLEIRISPFVEDGVVLVC